jgi:serine/threonine-protein kinase HSL1 (negative regulator of Swe1 kinase)
LEYVNNGELFDYISQSQVGLQEDEALKFFRQILSAVGYCHSFNICHRDLKLENILLTKELDIKIADFGMAALHQTPGHKLKTSCGSPHYAAPEVIRGSAYHGNQVDIWSMGVILYATLCGRLPFDVGFNAPREEVIRILLRKIKLGRYEIAPEFSQEAKDLIRRMLEVNPHKRITLREIWRHPLLRKYDYLDNLASSALPQSPNAKNCGRPVLRRSEIDKELLRHLRSMWHGMSEQQLIETLLSEK